MSVIHRESFADSSHPNRSAVLEDILRDAAYCASEEEVPTGLAYRALARRIAAQAGKKSLPSAHANRKQGVVLWFGGLSAGTLVGASAAILIMAQLNGKDFRASRETASLPAPEARLARAQAERTNAALPEEEAQSRPPLLTVAASTPHLVDREAFGEVRSSAPRVPERREMRYSPRGNRPSTLAPFRTARSPRAAHRRTYPPVGERTAPPVARWKTETFEETEYQLVTVAYTPTPASGGYQTGNDHIQLTPIRMRTSFNSADDPMTGSSLPQY